MQFAALEFRFESFEFAASFFKGMLAYLGAQKGFLAMNIALHCLNAKKVEGKSTSTGDRCKA